MIRAILLLALAVGCLVVQGCFVTASMWQRQVEVTHHHEHRRVAVEQRDLRHTPVGARLELTTTTVARDATAPSPLPAGDRHFVAVELYRLTAAATDPAADMGAEPIAIEDLRVRRHVNCGDYDAGLLVRGTAPATAVVTELDATQVAHLADRPPLATPCPWQRESVVAAARLARALHPDLVEHRLTAVAWTGPDGRELSEVPYRDRPAALVARRLVLRSYEQPPRWFAVAGAPLALASDDDGDWYAVDGGLRWRLEDGGRATVVALPPAADPLGEDAPRTDWLIEWRVTTRRSHGFWGTVGRIVATPVTVTTDVVLFGTAIVTIPALATIH